MMWIPVDYVKHFVRQKRGQTDSVIR